MTKAETLVSEANQLTDEQLERVISYARYLRAEPFYFAAPPEALAAIDRGLAQLDRGEKVGLDELRRRLDTAALQQ